MIKLYKMPVNFKELKIFSLVICIFIFFISLIVPYGIIIKIMNKDLLSIKIKKDLDTYKIYRVKDYSYDQEYIKRPF